MNTEEMWKNIDKLLVIKRLRVLIKKLWNIQVNFTNEKGKILAGPKVDFFIPSNDICQTTVEKPKCLSACINTAIMTTATVVKANGARFGTCHAGFSTMALPIHLDNKFIGSVFGDGFIIENTQIQQRQKIKNFIGQNFTGQQELNKHLDSIPVLTDKDLEYLTELVKMVVDEILMTQSALQQARDEVESLKGIGLDIPGFDGIIGKSDVMTKLFQLIQRISDSNATVLIQGENGTGKELVAKSIHKNSSRKNKKMLTVNCGAFNENLLESELFGHVKGAFTGATEDRDGIFKAANGGTLFLDEIGDTTLSMQVKLLRVLQDGSIKPVGSTTVVKTDARVIAATNKNLAAMVKKGEFREDLFYRLNVINVGIPSLKDRKDDIGVLTDFFLQKNIRIVDGAKSKPKKLDKLCLKTLMNYDWPGNIRQLENEVERLCLLAGDEATLKSENLSKAVLDATADKSPGYRVEGELKEAIDEIEKDMILKGLNRTGWNKAKLAKELGISRAGLKLKVEKYGLEQEVKNEDEATKAR